MMFDSFVAVVPAVLVLIGGFAAMTAEAFRRPGEQVPVAAWSMLMLAAAGVSSVFLWNRGATSFGVVSADNFSLYVNVVLVLVGLLTVAFSSAVVGRDGLPAGEYYALTQFAIGGMMLMASAVDLLVIFLALEVVSLAVYVLTAIRRESAAGTEAAFKYFLLGAFSSAFLLYGVAFTYGLVGSTRLEAIGAAMSGQGGAAGPLAWVAVGLLLVGFAFKVSAVPFHMWTPDAYEGAPAVVSGFMSTGVKTAAFAALARVLLSAFGARAPDWAPVLWLLAVLTMIVGTFAGVVQSNLKRLLAYSSIAHAGYLLVALVAADDTGKSAMLFYLLVYAVSNTAAFGVVALVGSEASGRHRLGDYAGLWMRRPALAAILTVCLLSLGGFPPTAGFIAKWYVFRAAVGAGHTALAIIGVLTSVVSTFFYLRIVATMYMVEQPADAPTAPATHPLAVAALVVSAALIVYLGILPAGLLDLAVASISSIY